MSANITIKGKKYEINKDGSPKMVVDIDSDGYDFSNAINGTRKYYYFDNHFNSEMYDLAIFIFTAKKIGKEKIKEWLPRIINYNNSGIPIKILTNGTYEEIKLFENLKFLNFNIEILILKEIDFSKNIKSIIGKRSYNLQLSSDSFLALKNEVFENAEKKCQICNGNKGFLIPHHRSYNRVGIANEIKDIICVCKECHNIIHKHIKIDNTIEKKEI